MLTWVNPDDIKALGSLTAGIIGLLANLATFLVVSVLTGRSDAEQAQIDELFEVAAGTRAAVPVLVAAVSAASTRTTRSSRSAAASARHRNVGISVDELRSRLDVGVVRKPASGGSPRCSPRTRPIPEC